MYWCGWRKKKDSYEKEKKMCHDAEWAKEGPGEAGQRRRAWERHERERERGRGGEGRERERERERERCGTRRIVGGRDTLDAEVTSSVRWI